MIRNYFLALTMVSICFGLAVLSGPQAKADTPPSAQAGRDALDLLDEIDFGDEGGDSTPTTSPGGNPIDPATGKPQINLPLGADSPGGNPIDPVTGGVLIDLPLGDPLPGDGVISPAGDSRPMTGDPDIDKSLREIDRQLDQADGAADSHTPTKVGEAFDHGKYDSQFGVPDSGYFVDRDKINKAGPKGLETFMDVFYQGTPVKDEHR